MSALVDGNPVGMWTDDDLKEAVDRIVCTRDYPREILLIAELASRAFYRAKTATTKET